MLFRNEVFLKQKILIRDEKGKIRKVPLKALLNYSKKDKK